MTGREQAPKCLLCTYLPFGGLFPRPPPDGLPVVLGPLGGRGALAFSILLSFFNYRFGKGILNDGRGTNRDK